MAELADAADSKSAEVHPSWGFDPPSRHHLSPAPEELQIRKDIQWSVLNFPTLLATVRYRRILRMNSSRHLLSGLMQVAFTDYVVVVEHTAGQMPRDRYCDSLRKRRP